MQPFSINCVTCKSKLTVSNSSLLGQILACPKCNSMVQIPERSPAETEVLAPASESSASADVTKQSQDHSDTVEDFGYTAGQDAGEEPNQITNPGNSPPQDGENDEESSLQGSMAEWDDASATNKRKKLFISFSCISVLILISVILTFSFSGGDSLETADNPMLPPPPSVNAEQDEDIADPPAENPIDPEVTTENNDPEDMGDLPTQDPASEPDDPQGPDEPITPDSDSEPMDKESSPPTAPEGLTPETPDNTNAEDMPPENLDSVIDNVAPFLGNAPIDIENAAPVAQIPTPNNGVPRAPAAPINIAQGLNFTVPKIDITNPIPLNQFLQFLGTLCNIPFTFDFESLELANLSHAAGVQHTSENKTIEQILTIVLESLQLTHEIQDGHVLILAKSHLDSTTSTTIYKQQQVDAAQDEQTVKELSTIINKLLTPDDAEIAKPVADAESEDVFHLEISGTNRTQDKARQLLARLHTTPSETDSYEAAIWNQYQQPFTMDFKDGAPLLQVLIYLNSISELQFQANWKNIWQSGWTPKSQVNVKTENESLQECLDQVLTSNGLAYIARANGVLEITSAEHALDTLQIGLYDLSKMPVTKRDALVKTLQQLTADAENDITIRLMETLPDGRLGLAAPAAIHRLVAEQLK